MPLRPPAGFISAFYDPLKNPNAPTIGTATGGNASASVAFTAPSNVGGSAISGYTAIATPGGITGSAASSPISMTGLTNDTAYTFAVWATNTYGPSAYSAASGSVTPSAPIGLFGGGTVSGVAINNIDQIIITTTGNATDFGDLINTPYNLCAFSSTTRGVWAGGQTASSSATQVNVMQYSTITSAGDATDFGDLSTVRTEVVGASNATRGLTMVGYSGSTYQNIIEYVTIASTGNATDFGDALNPLRRTNVGGLASSTRALYAGGFDGSIGELNVIGYVTIATTGNATDFGDLLATTKQPSGASSSTRGLFAGGYAPSSLTNVIQYITIASAGNAADFGDLTIAGNFAGTSSSVRAVFGGYGNTICYVTIASAGNATDFGDLLSVVANGAACSNAHGGL